MPGTSIPKVSSVVAPSPSPYSPHRQLYKFYDYVTGDYRSRDSTAVATRDCCSLGLKRCSASVACKRLKQVRSLPLLLILTLNNFFKNYTILKKSE
jgi:hypothetical protein